MPKGNSVFRTLRRHRLVATFVCVVLAVVAIAAVLQYPTSVSWQSEPASEKLVGTHITSEEIVPTRISIPAINVNAPFTEPLGLTTNQEIQVPIGYEEVGYYKFGPVPGELGPAVVLGHVDSHDGPAVFYSLGQLEKGDVIEINRADGSIAVFEVETLEHNSQNSFPTEKVYGDIPYAGLRLITCSGTYNRGIQRYTHNLIVYAKLTEIRSTN